MRRPPRIFRYEQALQFAAWSLARAPKRPKIERPEPLGELVVRFALPLELCPTTNTTRGRSGWAQDQNKKAVWGMLQLQYAKQTGWSRSPRPLEGWPQVRCVRFSPTECDPHCDFAKIPIDLLCVPKGRQVLGLHLIDGDRWSETRSHQWWEPASRADACVYLEVRTG